jgi:hypothetical protein
MVVFVKSGEGKMCPAILKEVLSTALVTSERFSFGSVTDRLKNNGNS